MLFGFINVYKDELKVKDYNIFKAYYCGLCKALGKRYNQLVRLGLSYDMTFLSVIADSVQQEQCEIVSEGCFKHIGNRPICINNKAIDYSADVSIILTYHKLCDDIADEHSIKAWFAKFAYINISLIISYGILLFIFPVAALVNEFRDYGSAFMALLVAMFWLVFFMYDKASESVLIIYIRKFRKMFFR